MQSVATVIGSIQAKCMRAERAFKREAKQCYSMRPVLGQEIACHLFCMQKIFRQHISPQTRISISTSSHRLRGRNYAQSAPYKYVCKVPNGHVWVRAGPKIFLMQVLWVEPRICIQKDEMAITTTTTTNGHGWSTRTRILHSTVRKFTFSQSIVLALHRRNGIRQLCEWIVFFRLLASFQSSCGRCYPCVLVIVCYAEYESIAFINLLEITKIYLLDFGLYPMKG